VQVPGGAGGQPGPRPQCGAHWAPAPWEDRHHGHAGGADAPHPTWGQVRAAPPPLRIPPENALTLVILSPAVLVSFPTSARCRVPRVMVLSPVPGQGLMVDADWCSVICHMFLLMISSVAGSRGAAARRGTATWMRRHDRRAVVGAGKSRCGQRSPGIQRPRKRTMLLCNCVAIRRCLLRGLGGLALAYVRSCSCGSCPF
jgi:hypothetical protein